MWCQLNDNGAFLPVPHLVILAEMLKDRDTHRWVWAGPAELTSYI